MSKSEERKDTVVTVIKQEVRQLPVKLSPDELGDDVLATPKQHDPGKLASGPGGLRDATHDGKKAPPSNFPSDS